MNRKSILILMMSCWTIPSSCITIAILKSLIEITQGHHEMRNIHSCSDSLNYVSGGVTFNYFNLFSIAPDVAIAIEVLGAYAPGTAYSAQIVSNSSSQATVRVTKVTSSTVEEAATNEVVVHLIAIGS